MIGRFKGGRVHRDNVVTTSLDDLASEQASKDPDFLAEVEDTEARLNFVKRLAAIRKRSGVSQQDMAHRMGTTQSAISELEHNRVEARISTLQRYARLLGFRVRMNIESTVQYSDRRFHMPQPPVRAARRVDAPNAIIIDMAEFKKSRKAELRAPVVSRTDSSSLGGSIELRHATA